ncbi:MAG: DUF2334 domain-containing protein [Lentimicrobium sp.]
MSKSTPLIFFRNDDVRDSLDDTLIKMTELFIKHGIPVSHAVEPANISKKVSDWLISVKRHNPDLIEIIQHGFNHNLSNPLAKMEFGGTRTYHDQLIDIQKGKEIMDNIFGKMWSPVFTFPYGTYNTDTLKAVSDSGFIAISSKIQFSQKARIKNYIGKNLKMGDILGRKISYHPGLRYGFNFKEVSVSVNLIKEYTGYSSAIHYTLSDLKKQIELSKNYTSIVGILLHHRFHENQMDSIEELLNHLKNMNCQVSTICRIASNCK